MKNKERIENSKVFCDFFAILAEEEIDFEGHEDESKIEFEFDIDGSYVYSVEFAVNDGEIHVTAEAYNDGVKFAEHIFIGDVTAEEIEDWILDIEYEEDLDYDFDYEFYRKKFLEKDFGDDIEKTVDCLKKEFIELEEQVTYFNKKFRRLNEEVNEFKKEVKNLKEKAEELERKMTDLKAEVEEMKNKTDSDSNFVYEAVLQYYSLYEEPYNKSLGYFRNIENAEKCVEDKIKALNKERNGIQVEKRHDEYAISVLGERFGFIFIVKHEIND